MTDTPTLTNPRWSRAATSVDLEGPEMTLTLAEWHFYRDAADDACVVVPHEPQLQSA